MAYFNYDIFDNPKPLKMFLANPDKSYIGQIINYKNAKPVDKFNDVKEINFTLYECINGEINDVYSNVTIVRLIEIKDFDWFKIVDVKESYDAKIKSNRKDITLKSLEYELASRKVYDLNGVYKLCDFTDASKSLMHLICDSCNWNVGDIESSLLTKWRSLAIDESFIYPLFMNTLSKSFDCVFEFDTYNRRINARTLENSGVDTNIIISRKNIMSEYIKESNLDKIATKLTVKGGDDVDIRAVNPTGTGYLVNFNYYKNNGYMSSGLVSALNSWESAYNAQSTNYSSIVNTLKTKQTELTILESDLNTLNNNLKAQQTVKESILAMGSAPSSTDTNYTLYRNALSQIETLQSQIITKKSNISSKQSEIANIKGQLSTINDILDMRDYFTSTQLAELDNFITEGEDYIDDTFIVTDEMTDDEITEMKVELMNNASKELARISQPQYDISIELKNLFTITDNASDFSSYKEWRDQFMVGNIITVKFGENYYTSARIMQIEFDLDSKDKISVVISDRSRFDSSFTELGQMVASAYSAGKSYSLNKFGYDKAKAMNTDVADFIYGSLNAAVNNIKSNENSELVINEYGSWQKSWLPNQNKYDDEQSFWCGKNLLFTSDGWKTAKTGIGSFVDSNGNKFYGILGDVIAGELILGNKLTIRNSSGNFNINDNGFSASNGNYSVNINPSTPSSIFNIKVSGSNLLYVDTVNNTLKFSGNLDGAKGTFAGDISAATGTFKGGINVNNRFIVSSTGDVTLPSNATISWSQVTGKPETQKLPSYITETKITATTIESPMISAATLIGSTFKNFYLDNSGNIRNIILADGLLKGSFMQLHKPNADGTFNTNYGCEMDFDSIQIYNSNGSTTITPSNISVSTINGYTPITTSNLSNYLSSYATTYQISQLTGEINLLKSRVSALGG